ncbi:helix-turn-helix type 11 domain-containing protein [Gottschalkia acidurici 9a]|uniref:Helix-turn-helix type 11 domain-containing protein n=1 Tax=Gottschalkia acidurici (strain ATCC 7906 / DSM 604 / BCRC 14475 / CIP 104303 / KCTC 5404 / NCIMB 10678 / 9a) TaxID=1128398 RepID=K0AZ85_GOTA9|nr:transcriptional regulator [Gottschalkia acidurici]AFS77691.1 helix-turn-helix type 11 domain-containing protein [Gottschalkia acidurici 9a]
MSRVSNALTMYFLIQGRKMISVEELARELEVSERMIKKYKVDLEMAGIYISSKLGRYGGYYLETKKGLEGIGLTEEELNALRMVKETIKSGNYHYSARFEAIVSKLLKKQDELEDISYYNKALIDSEETIIKEKSSWTDINLAINQKKKIIMKYKSLQPQKLEIKKRVVHPYGIIDYKGATYFYGYCEIREDIRFFKLSRIISYEILTETFSIKDDFNFDEVSKKLFGIFNDKTINLKLKVHYPMNEIIKEKEISETQKITEIDDKTMYFEAEMRGYTEIKSWIMSMGSNAEVIEPEELKEDILNEIENLFKIYGKTF